MADVPNPNEVTIDDSRYSRQQYVLGEEAMKKMAVSSVFVSGLGGTGVEVAKNVALAGVRLLQVNDHRVADHFHLGAQYYVRPSEVGSNLAKVSAPRLAELNPYTKVQCSELDLATADLSVLNQFRCVVVCDCDEATAVRVNEHCHARNIPFLWAVQRGLFCAGFADFGSKFTVHDRNGEPVSETLVGSMRAENPLVIECLEHHRHGLESGDTVTFREVSGPELNGRQFEVTVLSPFSFSVPYDGTQGERYREGRGIVEEVKLPQERSYRTLAEQLRAPETLMVDLFKFEAPAQLHLAFRALHAFVAAHQRLPEPWCAADADAVLALASDCNQALESPLDEVPVRVVRALANTARASVVPLSGFLGGFMAQEVLKALSGKFSPLSGFLYLDAMELLPPADADCAAKQTRYDSQLVTFGAEVTARLRAQRLFVVGSGAIGCELLKNFALMGVSTEGEGEIVITDDDIIELSNLNRQFLFREPDVGKHKSECAARAVKQMNEAVRVRALQNRIEPKTVDVFSDAFFCSRDVIVNALDSVPARLYVDQRCVANHRPLLESGTMGAKGHVQVIIPFKTENYGSQRDPEAGGIPFCTLKSFPFKYEHCVQWARALAFEKYFVSLPQQYHKFFFETADVAQQLDGPGVRELKPHVIHRMLRRKPESFADCVQLARFKWERYFNHAPRHLLNAFPADHTLPDGKPFWSSPKRRPTPLEFNVADDDCLNFVIAFANLWAFVWGLPKNEDRAEIAKMAEAVTPPEFVSKKKKIETDESKSATAAAQEQEKSLSDEFIAKVVTELKPVLGKAAPVNVVDFEKDDDTNFHIDYIHAVASLRARVYELPCVDRRETKKIAGNIIPAIATTTAAVSALVALELVKLAAGLEDLENYKNLFLNLALPAMQLSEPGAVTKEKVVGDVYCTVWDRWEVSAGPNPTLQDVIDDLEEKHNVEVDAVFCDGKTLFMSLMPSHRRRLKQPLKQLLKLDDDVKSVDLFCAFVDPDADDDEDDEDEEDEDSAEGAGPSVRVIFE
mmetsp:Transcript_28340/g.71145  ORF Transcript_28340/g.71145 Transcript_28340/m.71145 type:complete len:1022 (+) Transcript_28340:194-3259(+)